MKQTIAPAAGKREFWTSIALVFLGGLACGVFIGVTGFNYYLLRRHPPSAEKIAVKVSGRIQQEYHLDETARAKVEQEILRFEKTIHASVIETHNRIDAVMQTFTDNIAAILPDESSRERWRKDYPRFIRKPPPPSSPQK